MGDKLTCCLCFPLHTGMAVLAYWAAIGSILTILASVYIMIAPNDCPNCDSDWNFEYVLVTVLIALIIIYISCRFIKNRDE